LSSLDEIADITAELEQLREFADDILGQAWSVERSRQLLDGPGPAFDDGLWKTVLSLGWPDVLVGESHGGGGANLRQLCALTEAAGAVVAPVPLAAAAAAAWCEQRCCDGVAVVLDGAATLGPSGVSGQWPVVAYGNAASRFLVLAERAGAPVLGVVDGADPGVSREAVTPLDHNPAALVAMNNAHLDLIADGSAAARRHRDTVVRAQLATVAELVGVVSAANAAAVEYAKVRVAFGRPIGAFQAVKHRLVDHRTDIEVARALINRAADACDHGHPDLEPLASLAVFWAIDSLRAVPEGAMQVFGGIGYTWEHDAHVYLRRAASIVATLGARSRHRTMISEWLRTRHGPQR
jgi:alkylation response protein AidB-like acyl-CoA dehydrogenase